MIFLKIIELILIEKQFYCNVNYMKLIINVAGNILDTLKSTYEHITKEELLEIICKNINNKINELNINNNNNNNSNSNSNSNNSNNNSYKKYMCEMCNRIFTTRQG